RIQPAARDGEGHGQPLGGEALTGGRSAGGGALLALHAALALDAVPGEGQRGQPLLGDLLAAALALPEAALVELPERGEPIAEEPAVAAAQLELELPRVGAQRLVAEILGGLVFDVLAVEGAPPDLVLQLTTLVDERRPEVRDLIVSHPSLHG